MRCALVNSETGVIENFIVADPSSDAVADGYRLVEVTTDEDVWLGDHHTLQDGFQKSQARLDQEQAELDALEDDAWEGDE